MGLNFPSISETVGVLPPANETGHVLSGSKTWDPGSVANGAQTTTTVTVTGALLGHRVVVSFSLDIQAQQLTGHVSATDTVTVVLRNGTGGSIDLASGTLRADVWIQP